MWKNQGVSFQRNIIASLKPWDLNHNLLLKFSSCTTPVGGHSSFAGIHSPVPTRYFWKALYLVIQLLITRKFTFGFTSWVKAEAFPSNVSFYIVRPKRRGFLGAQPSLLQVCFFCQLRRLCMASVQQGRSCAAWDLGLCSTNQDTCTRSTHPWLGSNLWPCAWACCTAGALQRHLLGQDGL